MRRSGAHGGALVEVLLAMALLGGGLVSLAAVQGRLLLGLRGLEWQGAATLLLYATYDDLRARAAGMRAMAPSLSHDWRCRSLDEVLGERALADGGVSGVELPSGEGVGICRRVQCVDRKCQVAVRWMDQAHPLEEASGGNGMAVLEQAVVLQEW